MTLRRALLQLAVCYPLSFGGAFCGAFAIFYHWLFVVPLMAFYWFFLSSLWHCSRGGNLGFLLAFWVVAAQAGLALVTVMFGFTDRDSIVEVMCLAVPAVYCIVAVSGGWEAYRIRRPRLALGFAATILALPGLAALAYALAPPPWVLVGLPYVFFGSIGLQFGLITILGLICMDPLEVSQTYHPNDIGIADD